MRLRLVPSNTSTKTTSGPKYKRFSLHPHVAWYKLKNPCFNRSICQYYQPWLATFYVWLATFYVWLATFYVWLATFYVWLAIFYVSPSAAEVYGSISQMCSHALTRGHNAIRLPAPKQQYCFSFLDFFFSVGTFIKDTSQNH